MRNPVLAAKRVLDELGINDPRDLEYLKEIAWERGALVQERHLDGAEARLTILGTQAIITVSTTIRNVQRQRFSIAHELGHLEMHRKSGFLGCLAEDIAPSQQTSKVKEQQANQFASAFLLPEWFFASLCLESDPSLDLIANLSNRFKVSLTATALRYVEFCEEPVAIVFSQNGYIKWFKASRDFKEMNLFVEVRSRLDLSSQASRLFRNRTQSRKSKPVNAEAWLAPGKYRKNARILEQSWLMPKYNAILTLLWVDDEIFETEDWW